MEWPAERIEAVKGALARGGDCIDALQLLLEAKPSTAVLIPLLPAVLDRVVDSTLLTAIALAKNILATYGTEPAIRSSLQPLISSYLPDHDEWHYRRIAELYALLNYQEELATFLALCRASANWEIRELADDFA